MAQEAILEGLLSHNSESEIQDSVREANGRLLPGLESLSKSQFQTIWYGICMRQGRDPRYYEL